jgi:homoserine O-acetyltransferase/O-succinyltransferase
MSDFEVFEATGFALQKGGALPTARLAYKTLGNLTAAGDNVVLIPSWYSGTHREAEFCMVGPDRAITPDKHFIVFVNLLSGGVSSSPSNTPAPFEATRFPRVTLHDNVRLQQMLLTERLGIERIKLVAGWSMGGCQAFQWGAQYPDMMQAIAPLCSSARTANFNKVFLLSLSRVLTLDPAFAEGFLRAPSAGRTEGIRGHLCRLGLLRTVLSHRSFPPVRGDELRGMCGQLLGGRFHPSRCQ